MALGTQWADGAWVDAGWVAEAWSDSESAPDDYETRFRDATYRRRLSWGLLIVLSLFL